jgi:group I intron endonuclease
LDAIRRGKGCPALADAIEKYGLTAFTFSVVIICFDEDLDAYEREYIAKYNTMVPNGYNILEGGIGGAGFKGKKHSAETLKKIGEKSSAYYASKEIREKASERTKKQMAEYKEKGVDPGKIVRNSENYKKALLEKRVGGAGRTASEEERRKTSESLKKYYATSGCANGPKNIIVHRKVMAQSRGKNVYKYASDGKLIKEYESVNECARQHDVKSSTSIREWIKNNKKFEDGSYLSYITPPTESVKIDTI